MSFEQLETVLAVADEGTVVQAARRLCLTQPPVSRRLLALEDELGVALFERTSRGMVPTAEGAVLIDHARAILSAVAAAKRAVSEPDPPRSR
ncbi:MAG: LysR family transcriptional regulator [Myxococcota bacterium]